MITEQERQAILDHPNVKWSGDGPWGETQEDGTVLE
mgnify:CR=1 FL=1